MGKSFASIVAGLALLFVVGPAVGWAQQATVKLVSPKDGEAFGPNISVKWEFKKGGMPTTSTCTWTGPTRGHSSGPRRSSRASQMGPTRSGSSQPPRATKRSDPRPA